MNIKKYSVLIGITFGTLLLIIATIYYPGGTYKNVNSEGYDWVNNYISNLLRPLAVNGEENEARSFAIVGVLFFTASLGVFFVSFSNRIKIKSVSLVIKYLGILATIAGFITVIPEMHDSMVTMSSSLMLLIFFYITIMMIKSNLTLMKVMSIGFLLIFYFGTYMYFTRSLLEYMPIMQKIIFCTQIIWVISLEYFTKKEDFQHIIK